MNPKLLITYLLLFITLKLTFAQNLYQQAINAYNNKQYKKAAQLFDKLYKQHRNRYFFSFYIKSLIELKDYKTAEKRLLKEIRSNPNDPNFYVDLGYIYELQGDTQKAQTYYKQALKKLTPSEYAAIQLANTFISYKKYDWAERTYIKAQKITKLPFYNQLYYLYALQRKYDKMIDALLNWLKAEPNQFKNITTIFARYIQIDKTDEFYNLLLKKTILKSQQDQTPIYNKLLKWIFLEKNQFRQALAQAIAYNYKIRGAGYEILDVGKKALENDSLDVAYMAFNTLVNLNTPLKFTAKQYLLTTMFKKITSGDSINQNKLIELEQKYIQLLNEPIDNQSKVNLMVELAHLQAFYLNKNLEALQILTKAQTISPNNPKVLYEKALILLKLHKPWDAILILTKASEAKNEQADNAKLLLAKTYIFLNDFKWAATQLDILEKSTDKQISNDAIFLSYILQPALNDSSLIPTLKLYAKALFYKTVYQYDSALIYLDSIVQTSYYLADIALMDKYEILYKKHNYNKAEQTLLKLISAFPDSPYLDKAIFLLASLYETKLNNPQKAIKYYKELLFKHKDSIYLPIARERFRNLIQKSS